MAAQHTHTVCERGEGQRNIIKRTRKDNSCDDPALQQCWVCGEQSSTYHYGIVACDGCKSFFSRSQSLHTTYKCSNQTCVINKSTRNQCQYCRWVKCLEVGMSKGACKLGRRSKKLKEQMKERVSKLQQNATECNRIHIPESSSTATSSDLPQHFDSKPESSGLTTSSNFPQQFDNKPKSSGLATCSKLPQESDLLHIGGEISNKTDEEKCKNDAAKAVDFPCGSASIQINKGVDTKGFPSAEGDTNIKDFPCASTSTQQNRSGLEIKGFPCANTNTQQTRSDFDPKEFPCGSRDDFIIKAFQKQEPSTEQKPNTTGEETAVRTRHKLRCHEMTTPDIIQRVLQAHNKTFTMKHNAKKEQFIKEMTEMESEKEDKPRQDTNMPSNVGIHEGLSKSQPSCSRAVSVPSGQPSSSRAVSVPSAQPSTSCALSVPSHIATQGPFRNQPDTCVPSHIVAQGTSKDTTASTSAKPQGPVKFEQPHSPGQSKKIWHNIRGCMSDIIEGVVSFAKLLPGFTDLDLEDRMVVIKTGCFEVVTIRNSILHNPVTGRLEIYGTDIKMTIDMAASTPMGDFVKCVFDFGGKINSLCLTDTEKALLSAVTLMSPDRPGLVNKQVVSSCQERYLCALQYELSQNHPEDTGRLSQVLLLLPKLREINCEHRKKLMQMKMVHQVEFPPLHEEVFDDPNEP